VGESQQARSLIDPSRRSFQLQEVPDWRLIQQHLSETARFRIFGAIFLVPKDWVEAHVHEDRFQTCVVGKFEFNLLPLLVSARLGWSFVREHALTARKSNTNDHPVLAQTALGIVEKDVGFQGARSGYTEAGLTKGPPDFCKLAGQAKFDFDFELQSVTLIH